MTTMLVLGERSGEPRRSEGQIHDATRRRLVNGEFWTPSAACTTERRTSQNAVQLMLRE